MITLAHELYKPYIKITLWIESCRKVPDKGLSGFI